MYKMLVFPAASKPMNSIRNSLLPTILSNALAMNEAIIKFSWRTVVKTKVVHWMRLTMEI